MSKLGKVLLLIMCLVLLWPGMVSAWIVGGQIKDTTREINFTVGDFIGQASGTTAAAITASTTPGLETDNNLADIVWADGETDPVTLTFQVPPEYISGMVFYALCDQSSASTTACEVDFELYINTDGASTWDSAAEGNTPVALATTAASPQEVTLTPNATDIEVISAGDWITINIWRDDTATGTADLEFYGLTVSYTADQ